MHESHAAIAPAAALAPAALEALGVSKVFGGVRALDDVSLHVQPGEIYCLLGANGAGKTTLINLFLGFLEPSSGDVRVNGCSVRQDPMRSKRFVAYIPEQVMLYGVLSGLENLRFFAELATGERHEREPLIALMRRAGLDPDVADRRVSTYSKGMRQKVGIAIALAKRARALLLDEPTSGLDPSAASEFSGLLEQVQADGVAVLTTTHDLFHAQRSGTRIGIMQRGRLVADLRTADLGKRDLESLYLQHMGS
jgi:ABC-2 type transport system ATP-binding protein